MPEALPQNSKQWLVTIVLAIISAFATLSGVWLKGEYDEKRIDGDVRIESGKDEASIQIEFLKTAVSQVQEKNQQIYRQNEIILKLQDQVNILQKQVNALTTELDALKASNANSDAGQILESVMNAFPHPAWLHEVGANKWFLNRSYLETFDVPGRSFWEPINVLARYPSEVAAAYVENDMMVIRARVPHVFKEKITKKILLPVNTENPIADWDVLKVPIFAGGRSYVYGACWPDGGAKALIDYYR